MKFLDYVCEQVLGPASYYGYDYAVWSCPQHEDLHPSFKTLPRKDGCKDRFKCWSCGFWGDEYDLLKMMYDRENFSDRKRRLEQMREDYNREFEEESETLEPKAVDIFSRGDLGRTKQAEPDLDNAWAMMLNVMKETETADYFALQILNQAKECCELYDTTIDDLVEHWNDFEQWKLEWEQRCIDEEAEELEKEKRVAKIRKSMRKNRKKRRRAV